MPPQEEGAGVAPGGGAPAMSKEDASAGASTPPTEAAASQQDDLLQVLPDYSTEGASAAETIGAGSKVLIEGLVSRHELNGVHGVVLSKTETGRWVVQPDEEGVEPLALKEANLTVVARTPAAVPTPEAEAEAPAPAVAVAEIAVGCTVVIDGLKSKPELNGTRGVVLSAKGEERWVVELEGDKSSLALKPANLTAVPAPAELPEVAEIAVGCTVVIDGLKAKPELNGLSGVVLTQTDTGQWVTQPEGEGVAPLALKAANLTVVAASAPAEDDCCSSEKAEPEPAAAAEEKPAEEAPAPPPADCGEDSCGGDGSAEPDGAKPDWSEFKPNWQSPGAGAGAGASGGKGRSKKGGLDEFLSAHGGAASRGPGGVRRKQSKVARTRMQEDFGAKKFIKP